MTDAEGRSGLSRRAARLFFRHHIENGISVSLWLAIVGLAAGAAFGTDAAIFAGTGAMCVSIVDQPGPLTDKAPALLAAVVASSTVSLLAGLANGSTWVLATVIAAMSASFALATAYGRPALTLGIAGVLALVLGMALPPGNTTAVLERSVLFFGGGTLYALLALLGAVAFDDRTRRMFLNEALLSFANYLRARALLYDTSVSADMALRGVIEAHGTLMERLQAARDAIFTGNMTHQRRKWIGVMLALLDAYEVVLSSDADWEALRQTASSQARKQISGLAQVMARDVEGVALALVTPGTTVPECNHAAALRALDVELGRSEEAQMNQAATDLRATRNKLHRANRRIQRLAQVVARGNGTENTQPAVALSAFVQVQETRLATLWPHLRHSSPVMRYAIRLTLAMLAGYGLTLALPQYVHGGWILLTVALIMRASYAITRQRRTDRILGTLAGCAAAALLIPFLPQYALLAVVVIGVGVAHAYATTNYRVTSFAASVMALLLLHFLEPHTALLANRIIDTLIGAGLSFAFSFLLPSWEWRDIPRLVTSLIEADRRFTNEALALDPVEQNYRLARKRALDSFTALATTTRRLSSEPAKKDQQLASLNELLAANYLLISDLASVQSMLRARRDEIKALVTAELLNQTRERAFEKLSLKAEIPPPEMLRRRGWADLSETDAMAFLRRRLFHIDHTAQRVAAYAARGMRPS